jgi:hypothetical protein
MSYLKGVKGNPLVTKEQYEIAKRNGISARTVRYRMQKHYTIQQAITVPLRTILRERF